MAWHRPPAWAALLALLAGPAAASELTRPDPYLADGWFAPRAAVLARASGFEEWMTGRFCKREDAVTTCLTFEDDALVRIDADFSWTERARSAVGEFMRALGDDPKVSARSLVLIDYEWSTSRYVVVLTQSADSSGGVLTLPWTRRISWRPPANAVRVVVEPPRAP